MFMTAAGSIPPAKVLILGAGVAGLQAIATARRLGAVVEVFDTRPAVKEEVMSLGAKFIEVEGAADANDDGIVKRSLAVLFVAICSNSPDCPSNCTASIPYDFKRTLKAWPSAVAPVAEMSGG